MKASYPIRVKWNTEDGVFHVQGLPPLTGVITYGDTLEDALENAREALTGILGSMLDRGDNIPNPADPSRIMKEGIYWIDPDPKVAIPILVRKARLESGMTLEELAGKAGVTYQQIQKWERSGTNPTISSLQKVFRAMGKNLDLEVA